MARIKQSNGLVVSFEDLKKIEKAGLLSKFAFYMGGLYQVWGNEKRIKAVLNGS